MRQRWRTEGHLELSCSHSVLLPCCCPSLQSLSSPSSWSGSSSQTGWKNTRTFSCASLTSLTMRIRWDLAVVALLLTLSPSKLTWNQIAVLPCRKFPWLNIKFSKLSKMHRRLCVLTPNEKNNAFGLKRYALHLSWDV